MIEAAAVFTASQKSFTKYAIGVWIARFLLDRNLCMTDRRKPIAAALPI